MQQLYNLMNILIKPMKLYTLKGSILWYVNLNFKMQKNKVKKIFPHFRALISYMNPHTLPIVSVRWCVHIWSLLTQCCRSLASVADKNIYKLFTFSFIFRIQLIVIAWRTDHWKSGHIPTLPDQSEVGKRPKYKPC